MATSKCGNCNSASFELEIKSDVKGSAYPFTFIQCSSCGSVVGVLEEKNSEWLLSQLRKKIENIEVITSNIDSNIVKLPKIVKQFFKSSKK
ncbi:hypothetical protein DJ533_10710 [Acinetobacter defluvii]|uniref:Uncharacterized protein n=1 Tax=Acinetobacter defluvii TaxID=1871111 RepID=A0A2S2FFA0_9GAMM|nr:MULTISPECIES: hypothetical protein [Acinetobacter]AWL29002.1 hypothetical protein DJ533_10710 [Acinetobacter defluvii]MDM1247887.1 hypothetical protein [Acinetobacter sp. R933-2]